ncbi:MAG: c-type cytochrome [Planctomycetes bacterium]|nr:c-type cytochrome [Planctomycetota bacterium]
MNAKHLFWTAALATALLTAACGGDKSSPSPSGKKPAASGARPISLEIAASDSPALKEAKTTFKTVCASCHGERGHGDGIAAATLDPKPRNYSDATWQDSVDDAHIKKVIVEGGAANNLSVVMPPHPQLADKDAVLDEIVRIIRSFRGA